MSARPRLGLADTSLFVAQEQDRPLRGDPPEQIAVSVISVGELSLGVLVASADVRAQRLETVRRAEELDPLPSMARWRGHGRRCDCASG
ncbi:MAG: hypothetical protein M3507_05745, partial [Actinomycetota bacterium]|nr:hypothetical protein [Actinomycetota bacterium]